MVYPPCLLGHIHRIPLCFLTHWRKRVRPSSCHTCITFKCTIQVCGTSLQLLVYFALLEAPINPYDACDYVISFPLCEALDPNRIAPNSTSSSNRHGRCKSGFYLAPSSIGCSKGSNHSSVVFRAPKATSHKEIGCLRACNAVNPPPMYNHCTVVRTAFLFRGFLTIPSPGQRPHISEEFLNIAISNPCWEQ